MGGVLKFRGMLIECKGLYMVRAKFGPHSKNANIYYGK
jgi:hypothetical protein